MLKDMDTRDTVVSSIRVGMKREFAFIMKAQSELRGIPAGRRVTRSQSVGNSGRNHAVSHSKTRKKMKGSASKKLKNNEEETPEEEVVGELEPINVSDGDNGAERSVVDVISTMDNCIRNIEADLVSVEGNDTEKVVADSREFAFMTKVQSELRGIPAGRRVTRSQSMGNSRINYAVSNSKIRKKMKGSASKNLKNNEEEKPEEEVLGLLEPINVSDGDNGAERSVVDVVSTMDNCIRNIEADLVSVEGNDPEKVRAHSREFAFMMKVQSELRGIPAGRRVTRSQSVGNSSINYAVSNSKIRKKMKGSASKKLKHNEEEKLEEEVGGLLQPINISDGDCGADRSVVDVISTMDNCIRNIEAGLVSVEGNDTDKIGADSREFAFTMKVQSELRAIPAGRRVTRSQSVGNSSINYAVSNSKVRKKMKGSASKKLKNNEEEKPEEEVVGLLEPINVSDGDNGAERSVFDVVSTMDNCIRNIEADLVSVEGNDAEKVGADSREAIVQSMNTDSPVAQVGDSAIVEADSEEGIVQSLYTDSPAVRVGDSAIVEADSREGIVHSLYTDLPVAQVGDSARVATHEDGILLKTSSHLGCESTGEGTLLMLENPLRRSTCSDLKLRDVEIELRSPSADVETSTASPSKLEMKMSKKIGLDRIPRRLKDLLVTGLLEGLHVRYVNGSKGKKRSGSELWGIIKGTGILCSCNECEGKKVVTPNQFEMHAHSANKRPPEYIYLENGKCLRDVLNACKTNLSDSLEAVIQNAIGRSNCRTAFCLNCRGLIPESGSDPVMLLCDSCVTLKVSSPSQTQNSDSCGPPKSSSPSQTQNSDSYGPPKASSHSQIHNSDSSVLPTESKPVQTLDIDSCIRPKESSPCQTHNIVHRSPLVGSSALVSASCLPEVLGSAQVSSNCQPQVKCLGKLTRKDLRLHKSVLAEDLLPDGTALSYVLHGEIKLEGYKKDGAVFCFCCNKVVSPSQFEAHAGFASRRKPYMSIYTSNGVSLHQLSLEISRSRKSSAEENDDLCSICKDGGELLCCENCPRSFHTECVGLSSIPQETWYCKYCQNMFEKEKFAEQNANAIAAGRVPGVDPLEDITRRCIRIIANVEKYIGGGCIICRVDQFSKSGFNDHTVMICDQCEREYHVKCLREQHIDDLKALPETEWFCRKECSSIYSILQKLIGDGEQSLPEAVLNILEKKGDREGSEQNPKPDIRWRLLRGKVASEDTRMWLSGAVTIFHDRFDPIADASTSRLDLIPTMVYGRKFKDQEFYGMYCAILTVDSVVVSAAIMRVFGEEVAELPLVATRSDCQGKGYFQALFVCIEDLLSSLNVKNLVLPAADEAESLWKNRFGFEKLGKEQLDEYNKSYQLMIFKGTSALHKSLIPKS